MDYQSHLSKVCADPERLCVFGLIIYSDASPHVLKVLADQDYWNALSELSGDQVEIFSARPDRKAIEQQRQLLFRTRTRSGEDTSVFNCLTSIGTDPNDAIEFVKTFHLQTTASPRLIIFSRMPDESIAQFDLSIDEASLDDAYSSLCKLMKLVTTSAKRINADNIKNAEGVFEAFQFTFKERTYTDRLLIGIKWIPMVNKVLKLVGR